jgi:alpha-galactosidase
MNLMLLAVAAAFSFGEVKLECRNQGDWKVKLVREVAGDGVEIARITVDNALPAVPPAMSLSFEMPQVDIGYAWDVNRSDCRLPPNWGGRGISELARGMPLYVYFNGNNRSRVAISASECSRHLNYSGGIKEEGSLLSVGIGFFETPEAPISHYETAVRIDTRDIAFATAVRDSVAWMEKEGGYKPCKVPEAAFDPLYSTWYCFHQNVFDRDIEAELKIAASLGMKTVIVDDGWQTDDTNRGYNYCGDWKVSKRRFPDMAAHVRRVHELGMKYMLWYSVPFIGIKSENYERFKGKYLRPHDLGMGAGVLDPRFPEVRKFLIDTYVTAMKEWDLDGFKLDFIDAFRHGGTDPAIAENFAGRDIKSVPLAVEKLMTDVHAALSAIKPDVLVEFRQSYVGTAIRQFGNMLRVGDCPGDYARNRVAIANLRLTSGTAAVHADMLEWNFREPPEKSALFIINSMFGVVQYSVMLRDAPAGHLAMIRKWMDFSQRHRDTLLHGRFTPHHPELFYPVIEAESEKELIIGLFDDGRVIDVPKDKKTIVMNASGRDSFVIRRDGKLTEIKCKSCDYIEL